MFANPPGQQTVNRAELYALILGGEASESLKTAYTDSSYAIRQLTTKSTKSTNVDLVEDAVNSIPNVGTVKVKAHAESIAANLHQVRNMVE